MDEFDVDPAVLKMTARDVDEIAGRAGSLARLAHGMAQTPMRHHFPDLPEAREAVLVVVIVAVGTGGRGNVGRAAMSWAMLR